MEYNNDPTGPLEAVMRASREGNLNSEAFGGPRVEVDEKTRAVLESLQSLTTGGGANAFVGASNAALVQDSAEEFVAAMAVDEKEWLLPLDLRARKLFQQVSARE